MKFSKKEYIEDFQNGNIYMNRLQFYNDLEKKDGNIGVGDKLDGKIEFKHAVLTLYASEEEKNKNNPLAVFENGQGALGGGFENKPAFCMFSFDERNISNKEECIIENDGKNLMGIKYIMNFTEIQKCRIPEFGEWGVVITDNGEFIRRLNDAFDKNGIFYKKDWVKYYKNTNSEEQFDSISNEPHQIAFWKRDIFAYQQEFRIQITNIDVKDSYKINIGDIHDISKMMRTKDILNMQGMLIKLKE